MLVEVPRDLNTGTFILKGPIAASSALSSHFLLKGELGSFILYIYPTRGTRVEHGSGELFVYLISSQALFWGKKKGKIHLVILSLFILEQEIMW